MSRDGNYVAVGYTSGVVSVLDIRTGLLLASWKAHEGEILQVCEIINGSSFWWENKYRMICNVKTKIIFVKFQAAFEKNRFYVKNGNNLYGHI